MTKASVLFRISPNGGLGMTSWTHSYPSRREEYSTMEGGVQTLPQLNQMELQELRHLIGAGETAGKQFGFYAQQCNDPQLRAYLEDAATKAAQNSRNLMGFLQI